MATLMKTGGAWIKSLTEMVDAKFANVNLAKIIIENTLKLAKLFFVTFLWSMVTKKFLWGTLVVATKRRWPLASGTYWDDNGIRMHTFAWRNPMKPQSEHQPIRFWRMDITDVIGEVYTSVAILMIGLILPAYGYTSYPYAVYLTMGSLWLIGTASNMKDPDVTWIEIIYDLGFVLWMMSGGVGGSNSFLFGADPFMLGATGRIMLHFAVRPVLYWLKNLKQDSDYGKNEEETVETSQVPANTARVLTRVVATDDEEEDADADADEEEEDNEAPV